MTRIGRESCDYHSPLDWPEGCWQKASTTTLLCETWLHVLVGRSLSFFSTSQEWLEYVLSLPEYEMDVMADQRWRLIRVMVMCVNRCFSRLYGAGYWLRSEEAKEIASDGLASLRAYWQLAQISLQLGEPRFPVHSKYHMLFHSWRKLHLQAQRLDWQESPLADSCQMDETFVGVLSRYSRRVSPTSTIERTLDIYLTALRDHFKPMDA